MTRKKVKRRLKRKVKRMKNWYKTLRNHNKASTRKALKIKLLVRYLTSMKKLKH